MLKNYKQFIILFAAIFALLALVHPALALEVNYPTIPIPGIPTLTSGSNATQYLAYFFGLAILAGGVLGVLYIMIAGIQLLTSIGNPAAISGAREKIFGAILGLVLLMFSFILLNTINPQFTKPIITTLPVQPGVYYVNTNPPQVPYNFNPLKASVAQAQEASFLPAATFANVADIPAGYDLYYKCDLANPVAQIVTLYPNKINEDDTDADAKIVSIPCVDTSNGDIGKATVSLKGIASFKREPKTPGIYLFSQLNCKGPGTDGNITKVSGEIPSPFKNNVLSARIVNGATADDPRRGFVLNTDPELKGMCSKPFMNFETGDLSASFDSDPCINIVDNSTCSILPPPKPTTIVINKACDPAQDTGKFNLQIDGVTVNPNTACQGNSGPIQISPGTHAIKETAAVPASLSDYQSTFSGDCDTSGQIAINEGEAKSCTITNKKNQTTLEVKKVCAPTTDTGKFNLQIDGATKKADATCAGGANSTTGPVAVTAGSHAVGETQGTGTVLSNYKTSIDCDGVITSATSANTTLAAGDHKTCTITNAHNPSAGPKLTVKKNVVGGTLGKDDFAPYKVVNTSESTKVKTVTLDQKTSFDPGTYAVREATIANYTASYSGDCPNNQVILAGTDDKTCTITNTYTPNAPARLIVAKKVHNNFAGTKQAGDFALWVDQTTQVVSGQANIFAPGSHNVSETPVQGYNLIYDTTSDCDSHGYVNLVAGATKTCIMDNYDMPPAPPAYLNVVKEVVADSQNNAGPKRFWDFPLFIYSIQTSTFLPVTSNVPNQVPPGAYRVVETPENPPYTESISGNCDPGGNVNIIAGDNKTCTIYNTYNTAPPPATTLTLKKTVAGGGPATKNDWTLTATSQAKTISGKDGDLTITTAPVPAGTYALSESGGPSGSVAYLASLWSCSKNGNTALTVPSGSITIAAGDNTICTITNSFSTPTTTFSIGGEVYLDGNFNLLPDTSEGYANATVELRSATGALLGTKTTDASGNYNFANEPAGTYNVQLAVPAGYTLESSPVDSNPRSVTVGPDQLNVNFGIKANPTGSFSISGNVFIDADGSGTKNGTETGYAGATVTLHIHTPSQNIPKITDASGNYSFTNLPAATQGYDVTLTVPNSYTYTTPISYANITLGPNTVKDFGIKSTTPTTASLTVIKQCTYSDANGRFNLQIDNQTAGAGADAPCGGNTGAVILNTGAHTIKEIAGAGTNLSNYDPPIYGGGCNVSGSITLVAGDNKVCTITNTHKTTLTLNKVLVNNTTDKFNLYIKNGSIIVGQALGVGNGGTVTVVINPAVQYTVSETTVAPATFSNYKVEVSGACNPTTVNNTSPGNVPVGPIQTGVSNVCTITNTNTAPPAQYTLMVNSPVTGVVITSPSYTCGTNINCGGSTNYTKPGITSGTSISLDAPASVSGNSNFSSWNGCDNVSARTCTVIMNAARTVTVNYTNTGGGGNNLIVSKAGNGGGTGTVTSNPAGINCGTTCVANYANNTPVTLTETPSAGSTFAGWSQDCLGTTPTCSLTMNAAKSVTATFNASGPPPSGGTHKITGNVFIDTNANGALDNGEVLYTATALNVVAQETTSGATAGTTTNAGNYAITSLTNGTYSVRLSMPSNFIATNQNPKTVTVSGADVGGRNFGMRIPPPPPAPPAPTLISPANNALGVSRTPTLRWNASTGANAYRVQMTNKVSSPNTPDFSGTIVLDVIVSSNSITTVSYTINGSLPIATEHYWRVNASNSAGISPWSATWNFTTTALGFTPRNNPFSLASLIGGAFKTNIALADTVPPNLCPPFKAASIYIIHGASQKDIAGIKPEFAYPGNGFSAYEDGGTDKDGVPLTGPRFINMLSSSIGGQFTLNGDPSSNIPGSPYKSLDELLKGQGDLDPKSQGKDICALQKGQKGYSYPCTKSVVIRGNYLHIIYTQNNSNNVCGFYTSSIKNLSAESSLYSENRTTYREDFFPIQP